VTWTPEARARSAQNSRPTGNKKDAAEGPEGGAHQTNTGGASKRGPSAALPEAQCCHGGLQLCVGGGGKGDTAPQLSQGPRNSASINILRVPRVPIPTPKTTGTSHPGHPSHPTHTPPPPCTLPPRPSVQLPISPPPPRHARTTHHHHAHCHHVHKSISPISPSVTPGTHHRRVHRQHPGVHRQGPRHLGEGLHLGPRPRQPDLFIRAVRTLVQGEGDGVHRQGRGCPLGPWPGPARGGARVTRGGATVPAGARGASPATATSGGGMPCPGWAPGPRGGRRVITVQNGQVPEGRRGWQGGMAGGTVGARTYRGKGGGGGRGHRCHKATATAQLKW
jgi:hypothetical protein